VDLIKVCRAPLRGRGVAFFDGGQGVEIDLQLFSRIYLLVFRLTPSILLFHRKKKQINYNFCYKNIELNCLHSISEYYFSYAVQ